VEAQASGCSKGSMVLGAASVVMSQHCMLVLVVDKLVHLLLSDMPMGCLIAASMHLDGIHCDQVLKTPRRATDALRVVRSLLRRTLLQPHNNFMSSAMTNVFHASTPTNFFSEQTINQLCHNRL
jgi:hypothetical protein